MSFLGFVLIINECSKELIKLLGNDISNISIAVSAFFCSFIFGYVLNYWNKKNEEKESEIVKLKNENNYLKSQLEKYK